MSSNDAVRQYLLDQLRRYEEEDAEYLAEELDASLLKQRLSRFNRWGWTQLSFAVIFVSALVMMVVPIFSATGDSVSLGGAAFLFALLVLVNRWERKKMIYEILALLADPEYQPESLVPWR